jgi:hypothetical protein
LDKNFNGFHPSGCEGCGEPSAIKDWRKHYNAARAPANGRGSANAYISVE